MFRCANPFNLCLRKRKNNQLEATKQRNNLLNKYNNLSRTAQQEGILFREKALKLRDEGKRKDAQKMLILAHEKDNDYAKYQTCVASLQKVDKFADDISMTKELTEAMKAGTKFIQFESKGLPSDGYKIIDDLDEAMALASEATEFLSQPSRTNDDYIDEEELDRELETLSLDDHSSEESTYEPVTSPAPVKSDAVNQQRVADLSQTQKQQTGKKERIALQTQ